ncbi:hypothetical protein GTY65_07160 [Streptomyces sp. SID8379]|nr:MULTISPECIES: hypothetical protein [unclassified Streptomyces]MYW63850.1 hypothetical protein [Streptomyces sp. SID8379]
MPKDPYALLRALLRAEAARDSRADQRSQERPAPQDRTPQAHQEKNRS